MNPYDFQLPSTSRGKRNVLRGQNNGNSRAKRQRRMARPVESQYKDLLNPVKDPEKSFSINISELLQSFVSDLLQGRTTPNFNSAALLLQGSASIYGKKVEYLHNLATQLHNNLLKQKKDDQQRAKKETKEKEKKEEKMSDPFLSVEIKIGKNLSCLRKKNAAKMSSKKPAKRCKSVGIPINLLSADNEEKGDVFYDVRGEIVGNRGDFALNKCRLISSGWLLLPTVSLKLVPSFEAVPEYCDDSRLTDKDNSDDIHCDPISDDCFDNILQPSLDEGFGSDPASNEIESTPCHDSQNDTETPSQGSEVPLLTDEGIGSTPNDDICPSPGTEGIENVPTDCGDEDNSNQAPMPVRQTIRQALKTCQLALEDDPLAGVPIDKELLIRKKIQKRNTRCLPNKLKMSPGEEEIVCSISDYCARTFFAMDGKALKNSLLAFDVDSFDQNSRFVKRVMDKITVLKSVNRKNKSIEPIEDEREIDVEGVECLKDGDANEDDETLCIPFDDNDIQIENEPNVRIPEPTPPPPLEGDVPDVPASEMPSPDISHIAHEECENYIREVHQFVQNSDITQRVHAWEKSVKPFLDELEQRESFDINLYGSRILNAFEDNNRKQTMTFRQFCQNKEKWEIHRYFMALLPLANIGNVSIESEPKEDGTEEIFVTLLSRKMHHKELEEFGHKDGSHS